MMNGIRLGRVPGDTIKKKPLPEWAAASSLEWAIASEGEGALTEAVDGVRLLAVGEQGLAGEGYVLTDVAKCDVEVLADF